MAGINFTDEREYAPKLTFKNNDAIHGVIVPKGTFYCANKENGFNQTLCKIKQCKNCKKLQK